MRQPGKPARAVCGETGTKGMAVLKCRDMVELVTRYLEGVLPLREWLAARAHLLVCGPCRRHFAQIRRTIRFLGEGPPTSIAPEREEQILGRIMTGRREE